MPVKIAAAVEGERLIDAGRSSVEDLLRDPSLTAAFCANDQIAFGVSRTLAQRGFIVPDDVSVVGMDDEIIAEYWTPALTTYRLDFDWAGAAAIRILLQPAGVDGTTVSSTFGIKVRQSTTKPRQGPLPGRTPIIGPH